MTQVSAQGPHNPADRPLVTLDTNNLYALQNNEPDAPAVRQLLALYQAGVITVNIPVSTALEEQRSGAELEMHEYKAVLEELGIAPSDIFTHSRIVGMHVPGDPPGTITFSPLLEAEVQQRMQQILFPAFPFDWATYRDRECARYGINGTHRAALLELDRLDMLQWSPYVHQLPTPALDTLGQLEREALRARLEDMRRIRLNKLMDVNGLYIHLTQAAYATHPEHAVFVTNDDNFHRLTKLAALRQLGARGEILRPAEAVVFLLTVTGASLVVA